MRLDRVCLCHPGCDKDAAEAAALYISGRDISTGKGHDSEQWMEREREGRERKERWMTAAAKRLWFFRLTARERSGKQSSTPTLHLSPSPMHAGRLYSVLSIFWLVARRMPRRRRTEWVPGHVTQLVHSSGLRVSRVPRPTQRSTGYCSPPSLTCCSIDQNA